MFPYSSSNNLWWGLAINFGRHLLPPPYFSLATSMNKGTETQGTPVKRGERSPTFSLTFFPSLMHSPSPATSTTTYCYHYKGWLLLATLLASLGTRIQSFQTEPLGILGSLPQRKRRQKQNTQIVSTNFLPYLLNYNHKGILENPNWWMSPLLASS